MAKTLNGHYGQTLVSKSFVPAMLIVLSDLYHFASFTGLDLTDDHSIIGKQNLSDFTFWYSSGLIVVLKQLKQNILIHFFLASRQLQNT